MKRVKGTSTTASLISATLVSTLLVSALSGCSFAVTLPSAGPSTTDATTPPVVAETTAPEPDAEPATLTIGGCDDLFTLAQAKELLSPTAVLLEETPANEYRIWFDVPALSSQISGLTEGVSCWWGVPNSDYSVTLLVAKIDPATRASLEATLTTEGYSSVVTRSISAYGTAPEGEYRSESHLFTGDLWILADGPAESMTSTLSESALDAMRTANPSLGL
jgi:hypothetical protein